MASRRKGESIEEFRKRNRACARDYYNGVVRERRRSERVVIYNEDPRPPVSVLRERDHILSLDLTPDQLLLGDPAPGRSALDRMIAKRLHNADLRP